MRAAVSRWKSFPSSSGLGAWEGKLVVAIAEGGAACADLSADSISSPDKKSCESGTAEVRTSLACVTTKSVS